VALEAVAKPMNGFRPFQISQSVFSDRTASFRTRSSRATNGTVRHCYLLVRLASRIASNRRTMRERVENPRIVREASLCQAFRKIRIGIGILFAPLDYAYQCFTLNQSWINSLYVIFRLKMIIERKRCIFITAKRRELRLVCRSHYHYIYIKIIVCQLHVC